MKGAYRSGVGGVGGIPDARAPFLGPRLLTPTWLRTQAGLTFKRGADSWSWL